jgi:hypothetical protein
MDLVNDSSQTKTYWVPKPDMTLEPVVSRLFRNEGLPNWCHIVLFLSPFANATYPTYLQNETVEYITLKNRELCSLCIPHKK